MLDSRWISVNFGSKKGPGEADWHRAIQGGWVFLMSEVPLYREGWRYRAGVRVMQEHYLVSPGGLVVEGYTQCVQCGSCTL